MMPAMMPACELVGGELRAFVGLGSATHEGQRQGAVLQRVGEAGRPGSWVKLPVISAWPPVIGSSLVGSESTSPSSTIASRCWSPVSEFVLPGDLGRDVARTAFDPVAVELDVDDVVTDAVLRDAAARVGDVGAVDHRRPEQVAVAALVAGQQRLALAGRPEPSAASPALVAVERRQLDAASPAVGWRSRRTGR